MAFDGASTLEGVSTEEVWLVLSDSVTIERVIPGCQFPVAVDRGDVDCDALEAGATAEDPPTSPVADLETVAERTKHR